MCFRAGLHTVHAYSVLGSSVRSTFCSSWFKKPNQVDSWKLDLRSWWVTLQFIQSMGFLRMSICKIRWWLMQWSRVHGLLPFEFHISHFPHYRNLSAIQDREICCYSVSCKEKDNIGKYLRICGSHEMIIQGFKRAWIKLTFIFSLRLMSGIVGSAVTILLKMTLSRHYL